MGKENKCREGHSLTESIFIPYEYLTSLEQSGDLTSEAVKAESNGSDDNEREKGGECLGCSWDCDTLFFEKSTQVRNHTVG